MKSEWTHSICDRCWEERFGPESGTQQLPRAPVRLVNPPRELCCFCSEWHQSGIYVRQDPDTVECRL
jgi:hypothetical protein